MTKLKNHNCDKTQKLNLRQKYKLQIVREKKTEIETKH